jgi:hypothetical protein
VAKGNDKAYREWIQRQPSCVSGQFSEYVNGEGRCIAAHIRRAGKSGIAFKAEFSCVPLTDAEHRLTHQHGEAALRPKEWFDAQVKLYLAKWQAEQR